MPSLLDEDVMRREVDAHQKDIKRNLARIFQQRGAMLGDGYATDGSVPDFLDVTKVSGLSITKDTKDTKDDKSKKEDKETEKKDAHEADVPETKHKGDPTMGMMHGAESGHLDNLRKMEPQRMSELLGNLNMPPDGASYDFDATNLEVTLEPKTLARMEYNLKRFSMMNQHDLKQLTDEEFTNNVNAFNEKFKKDHPDFADDLIAQSDADVKNAFTQDYADSLYIDKQWDRLYEKRVADANKEISEPSAAPKESSAEKATEHSAANERSAAKAAPAPAAPMPEAAQPSVTPNSAPASPELGINPEVPGAGVNGPESNIPAPRLVPLAPPPIEAGQVPDLNKISNEQELRAMIDRIIDQVNEAMKRLGINKQIPSLEELTKTPVNNPASPEGAVRDSAPNNAGKGRWVERGVTLPGTGVAQPPMPGDIELPMDPEKIELPPPAVREPEVVLGPPPEQPQTYRGNAPEPPQTARSTPPEPPAELQTPPVAASPSGGVVSDLSTLNNPTATVNTMSAPEVALTPTTTTPTVEAPVAKPTPAAPSAVAAPSPSAADLMDEGFTISNEPEPPQPKLSDKNNASIGSPTPMSGPSAADVERTMSLEAKANAPEPSNDMDEYLPGSKVLNKYSG